MPDQTLVVHDDAGAHRYVVELDGERAGFAAYDLRGEVITFTHTEVDDRYEGHGVGSRLAREALADARERGLHVRPLCPFIARYIRDHQEFADLVG